MPDLDPVVLRRAAAAYLDAHPDALREASAPASGSKRSHTAMHWAIGALAGGQLADALSTDAALNRGASESNPVYGKRPSLGRLLATKAAITAPVALLLDKAYTHHPKVALAAALGLGALGGGLAIHNSRQGRK